MKCPKPNKAETFNEYKARVLNDNFFNQYPNKDLIIKEIFDNKNKKMKNKTVIYKAQHSVIEDLSEKGIVKFYGSVFGNVDRVGDVVVKGAYSKTIKENISEIHHYKNHDSSLVVGVLHELKEDTRGLLATSQLLLKTQLGAEMYEFYKAMAEAGKTVQHSIGYYPIVEEQKGKENYLKEVFLAELSSLTKPPANPLATTVDIKSFDELLTDQKYYDLLLNAKFPDLKLEELQQIKNNIDALVDKRAAEIALEKQKVANDNILNFYRQLTK